MLRDLSPYVCTYEICNQADELFTTRREWMAHEDHFHRGGEQCLDRNDEPLSSSRAYDNYPRKNDEEVIHARSDRNCPICDASIELKSHLQNHIAAHLERIAIFSLPRSTGFDEDEAQAQDQDQDQEQTSQATIQLDNSKRISSWSSLHSIDSDKIERQRDFARRAEEYTAENLQKNLGGWSLRQLEDEATAANPSLLALLQREQRDFLYYEIRKDGADWSGDATMHEIPASQSEIKKKAEGRNETGTVEQHLKSMVPSRRAHIEQFLKFKNAKEKGGAYWEAAYINNTKTRRKDNKMEVKAFEIIFARKFLDRPREARSLAWQEHETL